MKFFRPAARMTSIPNWDAEAYETAARRVRKMPDQALLDWTDQAGSGMEQGFRDYGKHADLASLEEISQALIALWALNEELKLRGQPLDT